MTPRRAARPLAAACLLLAVTASAARSTVPFGPARARAQRVVSRMTPAEELALVAGTGAGSVTGAQSGTRAIPRLGVPGLVFSDGPNGVGNGARGVTAFPAALTLAASWDPALARRYGRALADETLGKGRNYIAAPTLNIVRSPKWGRVPETQGEDPFLAGRLGAAQVQGIQSRRVIAQVKHFAVNDQEERRFGEPVLQPAIDARLSRRALREIYAEPFRIAIQESGAASIMCSYNRVNGTPACQNRALLGSLRTSFGFQGFIGPDAQLAVRDTVAAANAGLDNFSLGSLSAAAGTPDTATLREALASGKLSRTRLDDAATHVLTAIFAVDTKTPTKARPFVTSAAHRSLATEIAATGAVLLKDRRGVLPLSRRTRSLAVIGYDAGPGTQINEFGSPAVRGGRTITPLGAIRARASAHRTLVSYAQGTLGVVPLPIAPSRLLTPSSGPGRGLTATYYPNPDFTGTPVARRVDPTIDFAGTPALQGAASVRWTGTFTPRTSGLQRFSLGVSGIATLYVNGRRVTRGNTEAFKTSSAFGDAAPNTFHATLGLEAGRPVRIRVDYSNASVPPVAPFLPELHLGYAPPGRLIARAAAAARKADVAVVFANNVGGEVMDQDSLALPGDQDQLIAAVARANPRTVVVLHTAGPVLTPWRSQVAGIVEDWYPGQQTGAAIARVLSGDVDPSGRLPVTFPATATQGPAPKRAQFPGTWDISRHDEGLFVGYRFYDRSGQRPAYPFGYGLSYTSFSLGRVTARARGGNRFDVRVPVTNTGGRSGSAVAQLYLGFPASAGEPRRQLKTFARVTLRPGETRTVTLRLGPASFRTFDERTGKDVLRPGRYTVWVGTSSRDLPRSVAIRPIGPCSGSSSRSCPGDAGSAGIGGTR